MFLLLFLKYFFRNKELLKGFQDVCRDTSLKSLNDETRKKIIEYSGLLFQEALKSYNNNVKIGALTIEDLSSIKLDIVSVGDDTLITSSCLDGCVCPISSTNEDGEDNYKVKGKYLNVKISDCNMKLKTINIPFNLFGFMKFKCSFDVDIFGVCSLVETDGEEKVIIKNASYKKYKINNPRENTPVGKLMSKYPMDEYIQNAINLLIVGKEFKLPTVRKMMNVYQNINQTS